MLGQYAIILACKEVSPGPYFSRVVILARLDPAAHQCAYR